MLRCAGADVHKKTVVVCVIIPGDQGDGGARRKPFGTMTVDFAALSDWLQSCGVTHLAMESTGEYWKRGV